MKIFTWMQNMFNGRHESKKPTSLISASQNIKQDPGKEGFSERHIIESLLAIGTFGENAWKEAPESILNLEGNSSSHDHDLQDLTLEELGKLQNELNLILHKQGAELTRSAELERNNVEWKNLLDKDSSLDSDESTNNECNQRHSTSIIRNRGKDVCLDSNSKGTINGKMSLSFLLIKKMFVCSSGITPAFSLRDHALPESRMEKIMKAILHKKIYPQSSSTALSMKKYLDNRVRIMKPADDDHEDHHELNLKGDNGSKWVNTDSEYIVLEIYDFTKYTTLFRREEHILDHRKPVVMCTPRYCS